MYRHLHHIIKYIIIYDVQLLLFFVFRVHRARALSIDRWVHSARRTISQLFFLFQVFTRKIEITQKHRRDDYTVHMFSISLFSSLKCVQHIDKSSSADATTNHVPTLYYIGDIIIRYKIISGRKYHMVRP